MDPTALLHAALCEGLLTPTELALLDGKTAEGTRVLERLCEPANLLRLGHRLGLPVEAAAVSLLPESPVVRAAMGVRSESEVKP